MIKKVSVLILLSISISIMSAQYSFPDFKELYFPFKPADFSMGFNPSHFAPIGWSKKGTVAFISRHFVGGMGAYQWKITIFDAVNDKVLWSKELGHDEYEENEEGEYTTDRNIRALFAGSEIQNVLESFNIIENPGKMYRFPFKYKDSLYSGEIETVRSETKKDHFDQPLLTGYILRIVRDKKAKNIQTVKNLEYAAYIQSMGVSAALKSPYEDRVLVICYTTSSGFEGETDLGLFYSGAHLTYGF